MSDQSCFVWTICVSIIILLLISSTETLAITSEDKSLLCIIDFKSIELRVLAHFSSDSGLLKVLHESDQHNDVFISLACYW